MISESQFDEQEEKIQAMKEAADLIRFRIAVQAIKIPEVKSAENKRIIEDAKSYLYLAISKIKLEEEE